MCEPTTALTIGMAVVSAAMASRQAAAQEKMATEMANNEYEAARRRLEAEYEEANRQIAEVQEQELEDSSDLIRKANKELGIMRVSETALSDASLGNLYFESHYTNSADLQRLEENVDKQIAAGEASKLASMEAYSSRSRQAKNQAQNVMTQAANTKSKAYLNVISTGVKAGVSQHKHQQTLAALKN